MAYGTFSELLAAAAEHGSLGEAAVARTFSHVSARRWVS
jgi:hypothetical protein